MMVAKLQGQIAIIFAVAAAGCSANNEPDAGQAPPSPPAIEGANRQPAPSTAAGADAEAARNVEIEALRRGAPGVTTPVYDPTLADEPGRSFATQDEALESIEARERRRGSSEK
jgi:hypothetical protein